VSLLTLISGPEVGLFLHYCTECDVVADKLNPEGKRNLKRIVPGVAKTKIALALITNNGHIYIKIYRIQQINCISVERVIGALNTFE
jgi:hypothetical protein